MRILRIIKKKDFEDARAGKSNNVPVIMPDGIELLDKYFMFWDRKHCVKCNTDFYHTYLDCADLKDEMKSGEPLRCIEIKEAKANKMTYCATCSRALWLFEHDRSDEIE